MYLDACKKLLESVDLPIDGLEDQFENFLLLLRDGDLIGLIGLETHKSSGLLRSLAVKPVFQGNGLGILLTDAILEKAKEMMLKEVYLLTETAENFFIKRGFSRINRELAPETIKSSKEFAHVCPVSASLMKIALV